MDENSTFMHAREKSWNNMIFSTNFYVEQILIQHKYSGNFDFSERNGPIIFVN